MNGHNVNIGEKASYFTDINVETMDNTLEIHFNEKYTSDYENKNLTNRLLYKIKTKNKFENIRVYKNGEETYFDVVGN